MSASYASKLQQNVWRGKCGDPENFDSQEKLIVKCKQIAELVSNSSHVVIHTGAGVSTSAGIPDFRGPDGVWTRQQRKKPPHESATSFSAASPTYTHEAIRILMEHGLVKHLVTQNVDGLHRRCMKNSSRLDLDSQLSEIHGSAFVEDCWECGQMFVLEYEVETIGLAKTGRTCTFCGGDLRDRLCDWDSPLPEKELEKAEEAHRMADLVIVLGSSLRIRPAGNFPMKTKRVQKKYGRLRPGKIVIVNLQETHLDRSCSVRLFGKCDEVMKMIMRELNLEIS